MSRPYRAILVIFTLLSAAFINAHGQSPVKDKDDAKAFVQKFYDWYVPLCDAPVKTKGFGPLKTAVIKHKEYFNSVLYRALTDYILTPRINKAEETDVLDFDPFLNAQDTGPKYFAAKVSQQGNKYLVYVIDDESKGKKVIKDSDCLVITELVKENNKWAFSNFIYPIDGKRYNLLQQLKDLRKSQNKTAK